MTWCFQTSLKLPKGQLNFVEKWPMMDPLDLMFILIAYLAFVLKVGPILMMKHAPFKLKELLIGYNIFKIINCGYLTCKFFAYIVDKGLFPKICNHDEITINVIAALYWKFFATKLLDLLDTVFFVLRKKNNQISFLHVYHHIFMVLCSWTALKYDPSDHWAFMAVLNCFIHTVMYVYYGCAALGPSFAKYLWWKRYLTMLQLGRFSKSCCCQLSAFVRKCGQISTSRCVCCQHYHVCETGNHRECWGRLCVACEIQFVLVSGHIVVQTFTSECPIHAVTYWVSLTNIVLFLVLFVDFYYKRYRRPNYRRPEIDFACTRQNYD